MLTSKARSELRAQANGLQAVFQIGKSGVEENLIKQVDDALEARELIKIKALETSPLSAKEAAEALAEATGADVAFIGTSGSDIRCVFAAKGTFIPVSLTVYRTSVDGTDTDASLALTGLEKGTLLSDVLVQNGVSPDVQFAQAGYKTMDCLTPKPFGAPRRPGVVTPSSSSPTTSLGAARIFLRWPAASK